MHTDLYTSVVKKEVDGLYGHRSWQNSFSKLFNRSVLGADRK